MAHDSWWTTEPTEYHEFGRPEARGKFFEEWEDLITKLDENLIKSGPISERPTDPPTGRWYAATDEQILYRYDGNEWYDFFEGYGSGGGGKNVDISDVLVASPNVSIEDTELHNSASIDHRIVVPPGQTLTVYNWGVIDHNNTTPNGLLVELMNDTGGVVAEANDSRQADTTGVAEWTNDSDSEAVAQLSVVNETGSDYSAQDEESISAHFGYEVA